METSRPTVLFVDDEENVLRGIKRMLRSKRGEWETLFANSGEKALSLLDAQPVSLVVSDMRMPGMDGAELLTKIQEKHPDVIRIVLSGYAEKEAILKTIGPSHQYIAKPCDQDVLVDTIQRSLNLRQVLNNTSVRTVVSGMKNVPALPKVFHEILEELDNELASADSLSEMVAKDISVSAHLMKLTNSAYFSLPMPATTPKQAISFLGFENVKAIVLLSGVFEQIGESEESRKVLEVLSKRSLQLGMLARALAKADGESQEIQDQAFCAGLIGHIGTLLLVANWPKEFSDVVSLVEAGSHSISEAEQHVFGTTHGALSAYLLGLWGFNDPIVEAVAYHHDPSKCCAQDPRVLKVLHVAQHLLRARRHASLEEVHIEQSLDREFIDKCSNAGAIDHWQAVYESVSKGWPDD